MLREWYLPPGECQVISSNHGRYHFHTSQLASALAVSDSPKQARIQQLLRLMFVLTLSADQEV